MLLIEFSYLTVRGAYMKPFIKLFKTPRCYYFFDVNRNMIHPVEEEVYSDLDKLLNGKLNEETKGIRDLKEDGWLSTHRPLKMQHELVDKVDLWLEHEVYQMTLQVTQACNLCCVYCPYANNTDSRLSRSHTSKTMSFETAKKAIDLLFEKSDNAENIFISFYGGEPLIVFPLIKKCVDYADEIFDGKKLHYLITTNATLLTDEMIDYFAAKSFYLMFSLDGPQNIHDKHRLRIDGSPTYDLVMNMLKKTVDKYGDQNFGHISINMVVNPSNSLDELIEWLDNDIFKKIIVQISMLEDDYLEKKFEATSEFISKFRYQSALSLLNYLELVDGLNSNILFESTGRRAAEDYSRFQNDDISLPDITSPGGPCVSGVRKFFVNTEGNFYPCEKVNELSESMVIGNLENGFDAEKIKSHLNISQLTSEACRNCWAQQHCSICQRRADGGTSLSAFEKNKTCHKVKSDLMSILYTTAMINECKTVYKPVYKEMTE